MGVVSSRRIRQLQERLAKGVSAAPHRRFRLFETGAAEGRATAGAGRATRTTTGSVTAGFAGNVSRARANKARARAAPGSAALTPTQRQCHGSHFTPCAFDAGNDISNP